MGAQTQAVTAAARLLDPVSVFTQIPATSSIAESPNPETRTPPRYVAAPRSRSTFRTVMTPNLLLGSGLDNPRIRLPGAV